MPETNNNKCYNSFPNEENDDDDQNVLLLKSSSSPPRNNRDFSNEEGDSTTEMRTIEYANASESVRPTTPMIHSMGTICSNRYVGSAAIAFFGILFFFCIMYGLLFATNAGGVEEKGVEEFQQGYYHLQRDHGLKILTIKHESFDWLDDIEFPPRHKETPYPLLFEENPADSPSSLVYLNNSIGYDMFTQSEGYHDDYFALSTGFDAQINQAYCGVASAVSILNSLRTIVRNTKKEDRLGGVDMLLPVDPIYDPYHYATQHDIFNACTEKKVILEHIIIPSEDDGRRNGGSSSSSIMVTDGILTPPLGLSLHQVSILLQCQLNPIQWRVSVHVLDQSKTTVKEMREILIDALQNGNARVLINYYRRGLGQVGGGHFSPIGAYHPQTDSFLIMDVAKYKYPPVWVPSPLLFKAMSHNLDNCGIWDWPEGQKKLGKYLIERPTTVEDTNKVADILGCKEAHRGFIIVEKINKTK